MLNPFINLINNIISIINFGLIVWLVMDLLIRFDIINRYNPLVMRIHAALSNLFEPMLRPIRQVLAKILPPMPVDLSPLALLLLLHFIVDAMYSWFYTL